MTFPTPGSYQEAVQFPDIAFTDPVLREAEPETTALGLPRAITGAFAVVFPMRHRDARWAVKCFVTHVKDQDERYRAISRHLRQVDLPHTVPFEYIPDGIRVDGASFPILKMEWIDAETLNQYVARHLDQRDKLESLAEAWRDLVATLEANGIAHGDLQHGNVLVESDGRLRIVDYDAMYVDGLRGKRSPEVGHRNYQHVDRDETDFGPYLDRFAALVIDTGLQACAARPELWERFDTGENILFRADDLADPSSSALMEELASIDGLKDQVEALRRACYLEPEDIPPLELITSNTWVVPDRPQRARSSDKTAFDRYIYPIAAAVLVAVALTQAIGSLDVIVLVATVAAIFGAVMGWLKYRQLPVVRRHRRLRKEVTYFDRLLAGLHDDVERYEKRLDRLRSSHALRREERLEELREEILSDRLKHHFIAEARDVDGISHKVVIRLKLEGIRTAAHATPDRIQAVKQMSDESKAHINLWRASLVAQYGSDIPADLSPAEERRLQRGLDRESEALAEELARLRKKIEVQEVERQRIIARKDELDVPGLLRYLGSIGRAGDARH